MLAGLERSTPQCSSISPIKLELVPPPPQGQVDGAWRASRNTGHAGERGEAGTDIGTYVCCRGPGRVGGDAGAGMLHGNTTLLSLLLDIHLRSYQHNH